MAAEEVAALGVGGTRQNSEFCGSAIIKYRAGSETPLRRGQIGLYRRLESSFAEGNAS
ncbi:hypothetical protein SMC26_44765 [Actinomadura fulvescens]|uniref:hypothetical protein n=1 Tax=Actinomadura fulvescens TaxID=46160 RepID=UPI0031E01414